MISVKDIPRKNQSSHAHRLLAECLKRVNIYYRAGETPVNKNKYGKPYLPEYPNIHFNVSHAQGITACMISEGECGIDCENVREYRPNVVKRAFSENEKNLVENTPEAERNLLFFRLWTLKEAYVKAIGIGISYPLNTVSFSFENGGIITDIENYSFKQYIIHDGKFVVSLCEKIK